MINYFLNIKSTGSGASHSIIYPSSEYAVILFNKQKGKSVQNGAQHVKVIKREETSYIHF